MRKHRDFSIKSLNLPTKRKQLLTMKKYFKTDLSFYQLIIWAIALFMIACSPDHDDELSGMPPIGEVTSPQAEYGMAKIILMHTPGKEVEGQRGLHKVFNHDEMKEEHRQYKNTLKQNGITIYELTDVLQFAPIDKLRSIAQEVSYQDISQMNSSELVEHIITTPPLKGIYFTRDQSISTPRGEVICKMTRSHRQPEPKIIDLCYQVLGLNIAHHINGADAQMEGGDYLPFGTLSFIGEGQRTNRTAILELLEADAIGHDTVVVVKDARRNSVQMHLDTYFNIIDRNLVTLHEARINATEDSPYYLAIDIYTRPHGERNYQLTQTDISLVTFLQQKGITIIPISDADENRYASNYLCIGPRHIIAPDGQSDELKQKFTQNHVTVEWVKLDELTEGAGAAHCMTQVFCRQ